MQSTARRDLVWIWWLVGAWTVRWLPSLVVPFWSKDEGYWWAVGFGQTGGGLLYRTGTDHKPPLFLGAYGAACAISPAHAMMIMHALVWAAVLATAWIVARMAGAQKFSIPAFAAMLLLQINFVSQENLAANSETLMLPLCLLGVWWVWRAHLTRSLWRWCVAGVLFGVAAMFRQTAAFVIPPLVLWHAWERSRGEPSWRVRVCADALAITLGFLSVIFLTATYFAWRGTLPEFWFWFWTMSKEYVGDPISLPQIAWEFTWHTATLVACALPLWWWAGRRIVHWRVFAEHERMWLFVTAGMCAATCAAWRFSHHYYIHLFPCVAFFAAREFFVSEFCKHADFFIPSPFQGEGQGEGEIRNHALAPPAPWPPPFKGGGTKTLALILLALPFFGFLSEGYFFAWQEIARGGPRPELRQAANYVRLQATPNDRLFIWGYYPEIYFFAKVRNASRFVETHFLTGQLREAEEYGSGLDRVHAELWRWLWQDLTLPPRWLLDTSAIPVSGRLLYPIAHYPDFTQYILNHYELRTTIHDIAIYERR